MTTPRASLRVRAQIRAGQMPHNHGLRVRTAIRAGGGPTGATGTNHGVRVR